MNLVTLTRHLYSSGCACMHVLYIIWEYLFSIWNSLFESRHFTLSFSLSLWSFFMSLSIRGGNLQALHDPISFRFSESQSDSKTILDYICFPQLILLLCKYIFATLHFNQNCRFYAFCLWNLCITEIHYFTKVQYLLLLWVHTIKHSLYGLERYITCICMTKNGGSILRASERTGASICPAVSGLLFSFHSPHRHLNSAHFSRLTLEWVAMYSCCYLLISDDKPYLRLMNERRVFGCPAQCVLF